MTEPYTRCDNCLRPMSRAEALVADQTSQFVWFCAECLEANSDPDRRMHDRYDMFADTTDLLTKQEG